MQSFPRIPNLFGADTPAPGISVTALKAQLQQQQQQQPQTHTEWETSASAASNASAQVTLITLDGLFLFASPLGRPASYVAALDEIRETKVTRGIACSEKDV